MSVAILQGGTRLGAYIILNSVARGGMGTVYHARHIVTNREVALKVLHPGYATDDFIARFRREAQTAGRLKHPNIIEVFDASQADGYYFIAMEYLPSGSVQRLITTFREQRQSAPLHLALAITRQIASALAFAHKKGFVHRDIKPSNILLDGNTRAVLSDFGIVFVDTATKLTLSTAMIGTPAYMSPEQGTGKPIDGRSDLYSLGVVLYELLTGATPFVANEPAAVIYMHVHEPAPSITNVRPDVPADARRILDALLAKKPDDRFANGEALIAAIDSVAPPTSSPASLGMPTSNRRKASMLALGAGGTAIALLGVGALIFTRPTPGIIAVPISTAPRPNATNTLVPRATAAGAGVVTPTVTVVITTTPPQTVTATPKPTNTPSPTATSTPQPTATVVPTATPTPTKTATRRPRPTATVTKTAATPTSSPPAEAPTSAPAQNTGGGSSNNGGGSGGGSQQPQPVQPTAAPQPTQAPAPAPTDVPQPTQAPAPASTSTPQPPPP